MLWCFVIFLMMLISLWKSSRSSAVFRRIALSARTWVGRGLIEQERTQAARPMLDGAATAPPSQGAAKAQPRDAAKAQADAQARVQAKARATRARVRVGLGRRPRRGRRHRTRREQGVAAAVLTLPVFRLVARCTDPKPPSPIGSGAISQRALSALNFVSLPLESLPPPQQPIVQANQLRTAQLLGACFIFNKLPTTSANRYLSTDQPPPKQPHEADHCSAGAGPAGQSKQRAGSGAG